MIGVVIASHSARLAEGVCELAAQAAQGKVRLAAAGGAAKGELGTDAFKVLQAIESVYSEDGVLVLMDLGSAVLSAETALELLDEAKRRRVRLCSAPLVEGAVAAVSQAAAGGTLEESAREAETALAGKTAHIATEDIGPAEDKLVTLVNPLGLHARPAAQLIRLARQFRARVTLENITAGVGPAEGGSINGVLGLGARQGHRVQIRAQGAEAREAIAALAAFFESGCGDRQEEPAPAISAPAEEGQLGGIAASAGIALGPLVKLHPAAVPPDARAAGAPDVERRRLQAAIRGAQEETRALYEWARAHAGESEAAIFDAQALFLEDPALLEAASLRVAEGAAAEAAWHAATEDFAARLNALEDAYLRARAADVTDAAARVMRRLAGVDAAPAALHEPCIVAAHDLAPSQVRNLDAGNVLGLCLETGGASAHSVILARAMGIPAVVGLGPALAALAEGTPVALDGAEGLVWVAPDKQQTRALQQRREAWLEARRAADRERSKPAVTRDGRPIRVLANISGIGEAAEALDRGAAGVGVLRTEFLFLGRKQAPGEQEQLEAYRAIADVLDTRPLAIRTLDIGGDKSLPYVETGEEANPFLGWRGIRVSLSRRDLLRTQLRAILRASPGHALEVLLPMISSPVELRAVKEVLAEAEAELEREGAAFQRGLKVGVMIEVPAAVAMSDQLAREASFFSIGTNDLAQYAMAADRTNARVDSLADAFHPAVLRLIGQAIQAARAARIGVALCGELAADPLATALLIGLGLEEFSVSPPLIPGLKRAIGESSAAQGEELAREALALDSAEAVRRLLARG